MSDLAALTTALAVAKAARAAADAEVRRIRAEMAPLERAAARTAMERKIADLPAHTINALRAKPDSALVPLGFTRCCGTYGMGRKAYVWTPEGELAREILGVTT